MASLEPGTRVRVNRTFGSYEGEVLYIRGDKARVRADDGKERMESLDRLRARTPIRVPLGTVEAPPERERPKLRSVPKPKPVRSSAYLDYVRAHPCAHCNRRCPSEAAHFGGKGKSGGVATKASDLLTVPLCGRCHRHFHDTGVLPGGDRLTTLVDHYRWQRDLLAKWVEQRMATVRERIPGVVVADLPDPGVPVSGARLRGADELGEYVDRVEAALGGLARHDACLVLAGVANRIGGRS